MVVAVLVLSLLAPPLAAPAFLDAGTAQGPVAERAATGTVRDASGGGIAGATVLVRTAAGRENRTTTDRDGRFAVPIPGAAAELIVRATGFTEVRRALAAGESAANLALVLEPAPVSEAVTVTATKVEQQLGAVPASVNVLTSEDIRRSPAIVADDVLRRIPTFSLFRRTSSVVSHPTTQGVSLRGIGPSGVSRTLVLLDGIPMNDPFGGWVHWSRLPIDSADRVEVVEGSGSNLYGNYAMGGVISVVAPPAAPATLDIKTQYGSRNSPKIDVRASHVWGPLGVSVDASALDTDGYTPVAESERGLVDNHAQVTFRNVNVKVDYAASDALHGFVRVGAFKEERNNGKSSTIDGTPEANDSTWTSVSGGVRARSIDYGEFQATTFVDVETFHSNFLAVPAATPARSIGRMTLRQTVPSNGVGAALQWSRAAFTRHVLTAGVDWRRVDGDSEETALDATTGTRPTLERISGGTQQTLGVYVQDLFVPTDRLTVTLGARFDRWRNYDGHNLETALPAGTPAAGHVPSLPDRSDTAVSPRVAARLRLSQRVSVWGSASRGFRAPTLNELYRQFRVGTVLTLANHNLGPERLTGFEGGVTVVPVRDGLVRATVFDNRITDPVANVFQSQVGATVTQRRENLGRTRVRGMQVDAEYRPDPAWKVSGGYLFNSARVEETTTAGLLDKYLPQVPRHRGSFEVAYFNPALLDVAVAVQAVGKQFDDDLNVRTVPGFTSPGLPKFAVVDLSASRRITRHLDAFLGVQNLLDETYYVGTLPTTVGSPRFVTAGVRIHTARP